MQIKLETGTKKEVPAGYNTKLLIDGKDVSRCFNRIKIIIDADDTAHYSFEMKDISVLKKIWYKIYFGLRLYKLRR